MKAEQKAEHGILSFILWLIWIAAATVILGGVAYLFVGGSVLFSEQNTAPIVAYRQLAATGNISLTGSIVLGSSCERLSLENAGDAFTQTLNFTIKEGGNCEEVGNGNVPETFFIELEGDSQTEVQAVVNGVERAIIIK